MYSECGHPRRCIGSFGFLTIPFSKPHLMRHLLNKSAPLSLFCPLRRRAKTKSFINNANSRSRLLLVTWASSYLPSSRTVSRRLLVCTQSVTGGPWTDPRGGGQAELTPGLRMARMLSASGSSVVHTVVYLHNLMSPVNSGSLFSDSCLHWRDSPAAMRT